MTEADARMGCNMGRKGGRANPGTVRAKVEENRTASRTVARLRKWRLQWSLNREQRLKCWWR